MAEQSDGILIAHNPGSKEREIFMEVLGPHARVTFLGDLAQAERKKTIASSRILLSWSPLKEFVPDEFPALEGVRFIQFVTAGVDHVPFHLLPASSLVAGNSGAYAEPMAEHVLAMSLALLKRLLINHRKLKGGEFDQKTHNRMLRGLECGILGYGGIGKAVARVMRTLGMGISALNTSGRTDDPVEFIGTLSDLEPFLRRADLVVVSLPLTRHTRGLLGERQLSWMKSDAILINVARGAILDEEALYRRLRAYPQFMAGIDTWWIEPAMHGEFRVNHPFFDLPNFLGSPHNSPIVPGNMLHATRMASENVLRFLRGESVRGQVSREDYA